MYYRNLRYYPLPYRYSGFSRTVYPRYYYGSSGQNATGNQGTIGTWTDPTTGEIVMGASVGGNSSVPSGSPPSVGGGLPIGLPTPSNWLPSGATLPPPSNWGSSMPGGWASPSSWGSSIPGGWTSPGSWGSSIPGGWTSPGNWGSSTPGGWTSPSTWGGPIQAPWTQFPSWKEVEEKFHQAEVKWHQTWDWIKGHSKLPGSGPFIQGAVILEERLKNGALKVIETEIKAVSSDIKERAELVWKRELAENRRMLEQQINRIREEARAAAVEWTEKNLGELESLGSAAVNLGMDILNTFNQLSQIIENIKRLKASLKSCSKKVQRELELFRVHIPIVNKTYKILINICYEDWVAQSVQSLIPSCIDKTIDNAKSIVGKHLLHGGATGVGIIASLITALGEIMSNSPVYFMNCLEINLPKDEIEVNLAFVTA